MTERINFGGALRHAWRLLVVLAVVGFVIAVLLPISKSTNKGAAAKYRWKTTSVVGVEPSGGLGTAGVSGQTVLFWANNDYVKVAACIAVGMKAEYGELVPLMTANLTTITSGKKKAAAKSGKGANLVELTADQKTKVLSATLTNAYAVQVGDAIEKAIQAHQAAQAQTNQKAKTVVSGYQVLVPAYTTGATAAGTGSSTLTDSRKVRGLAGIVIGLVLGALIVLMREVANRRLRTSGGVTAVTQYPVVAEIPALPTGKGGGQPSILLAVVEEPRSPSAEAYRMLRMSVMFEELSSGQPAPDPYALASSAPGWEAPPTNGKYVKPEPGSRQVLLVVSPANEGTRPIVAANLGATYAEAGQKAIVVSTDDLDSGFAPLGGRPQAGSIGPEVVATYLQTSSLPNVMRLSFRHFIANSGQLVNLAPEVLDAARQLADVIIVESPPFLESHHGEALVHAVDAVLVVVESRTTTIDHGKRTGTLLRRLGAPVLGVVLTNVGGTRGRTSPPAEQSRSVAAPPSQPAEDPRAVPEAAQS
jgi:Mrp family chromosome partitioning ATPase